ncbi:MAG TPA: glycosyltransferase [Alphaproteobacteria bacterium]|nr:glycosyltransferase [Alphaproteobacteria bacterium]
MRTAADRTERAAGGQAAPAGLRADRLAAELAAARAEAADLAGRLRDAEAALARLTRSRSWRLTAPLRAAAAGAGRLARLLPGGGRTVRLVPAADGRRLEPEGGALPSGWVRLRGPVAGAALMVECDTGAGFVGTPLAVAAADGECDALLRLPERLRALRLAPGSAAPEGALHLGAVHPLALIAHLLRPALAGRPTPGRLLRLAGRGLGVLRRGGLAGLVHHLAHHPRAGAAAFVDDAAWLAAYRPDAALLARLAAAPPSGGPDFLVVLPPGAAAAEGLAATLAALRAQIHGAWRLCLAGADALPPALAAEPRALALPETGLAALAAAAGLRPGDYLLPLEPGDRLEPQALHRMAVAAAAEPAPPLALYGDEAETDAAGRVRRVLLHPAFSYDFYLTAQYVRRGLAVAAGALGPDELGAGLAAGADLALYAAVLRAAEAGGTVLHLAEPLLVRAPAEGEGAAGGAAEGAERAALRRRVAAGHGRRLGHALAPRGAAPLDPGWPLPRGSRALAVVPTRDRGDLLRMCVESLAATVPPGLLDLVVVDHESRDPETLAYLDALRAAGHRVLPHAGPFNFSAINNGAIARAGGDHSHILLLNNDVVAREPGWLERMLALGSRPDVGAVGAVLAYPDGRIQHAGVGVGLHAAADNLHVGAPLLAGDGRRDPGPAGALTACRDAAAATAACLLVRRDAFAAAGGFDERLAVGFNDVDLCLRIRAAGLKVLVEGACLLDHHESVTRGRSGGDPHPADTALFRRLHAAALREGDPWMHPLHLISSPRPALDPAARAGRACAVRRAPAAPPTAQAPS